MVRVESLLRASIQEMGSIKGLRVVFWVSVIYFC